jgi:hypothetical protein
MCRELRCLAHAKLHFYRVFRVCHEPVYRLTAIGLVCREPNNWLTAKILLAAATTGFSLVVVNRFLKAQSGPPTATPLS